MTERWADVAPRVPPTLRPYLLDFAWTHSALWSLQLPVESLPVGDLAWQLELPWWRHERRVFAISPAEVLRDRARDPAQFARVLHADLSYPLELTFRGGRWIILDGIHRLAKAVLQERREVDVRKLPPAALRLISAQ